MKYIQLFFLFITLLAIKVKQTSQVKDIDSESMDTWKSSINLFDTTWGYSSSIRLKSHSRDHYQTDRAKSLLVTAPTGYGLFATVKLLDLRPSGQDYISIIGGKGISFTYSNRYSYRDRHYYLYEETETLYAPGGQMNVTFVTGSMYPYSGQYDGFEIIFTVQANRSDCQPSYNFYCDNGKCIAKVLKCDGHNHCGDRSDQKYCTVINNTPGRSVGWIIGGVFFAVIGLGCAVYIMMRKMRSTTTETVISHPPPTHITSYPPPYPQGYPAPPPPYSQGINNPGYH